VTEWQVVRLIVSFVSAGVKIEHARFEIDLAVFKSSGMLQYGVSGQAFQAESFWTA
jgi:hypothetical protein